jgi:hypothetical protein
MFLRSARGDTVGSSDFPRSLCFMWFWFGLEILRPVYKKRFFKYWSVSILFELLTFKKTTPSLIRVVKNFFVQDIKKSRISRWFQKCVELLRQEVPKDLFSGKQFFAKFSKSLKIKFFCKNFFPFFQTRDCSTFLKSAQNSTSFDTLHGQFRRNFFSTLIRVKGQIR